MRGFGLVIDVEGAHRLVPVRRADWRHQCCQLSPHGPVYAHTVGTFGVASAAYWWARAAGALIRLLHYVVGRRGHLWLLLMADDMAVELVDVATSPYGFTHGFGAIFAAAELIGMPLSWRKLRGG